MTAVRIVLEVLAKALWQEKEIRGIQIAKGEINPTAYKRHDFILRKH